MNNPRSTAERMRPILQAMERSIDTARRRRLHDTGNGTVTRPVLPEPRESAADQTPRQKARPKRATPHGRPRDADYRAEAV